MNFCYELTHYVELISFTGFSFTNFRLFLTIYWNKILFSTRTFFIYQCFKSKRVVILFKQWRRLLLFSIRKRLQSFRRIVRRYWSVLFVIMTSFPTHSLVTRLTLLRIFCIASAMTSLLAVTSHAADDVRKWNIFIDDVTASRHYRHHALHNRWSPDHVPHATADEPADPCKAGACYPHS